jgi:3-oxoacyl-[acyl-carrier-protein] synthase-3
MELRSVGVLGTGSASPPRVLTNHDLERIVDTSDDWIVQRTGIRERRIADDGVATSDLALEASRRALEAAEVDPKDLDLIVLATASPDHPVPATSCLVQAKLGAEKAAAFDVASACTGFMTAVAVGSRFVASGGAETALVIGAECLSRITDYQDRTTCVLFGDGAGAFVLAPKSRAPRGEILATRLGSDGTGYEYIWVPGGGSRRPASPETVAGREHFLRVRGREVFRFAVTRMVELIEETLAPYDRSELGLVVPHQVNLRILEAALDRLDLPRDRLLVTIEKYGNTSAASVPVAMDEAVRAGRVEEGKLVVLVAFGAGLTWGSVLMRW